MRNLAAFCFDHQKLMVMVSVISLAVFVLSALAVPWVVARLPKTFFVDFFRQGNHRAGTGNRTVLTIVRNGLGFLFAVSGLIMLVTPGQGILTLLVGVTLMDFPKKRLLVRFLLDIRGVQKTLNWIRERRGRAAFIFPEKDENPTGKPQCNGRG